MSTPNPPTRSTQQADSMLMASQMSEPKGAQGIFELPCGLLTADNKLITEVAIREIRGHEEDMLASKSVPDWKKLSELITGCVTRIGPLSDRAVLAEAVRQLPAGDRAFLLFAIRRVSLGDILPFRTKCPNEECGAESLINVDLSELTVKKMPDAMKRAGYDSTLPSGRPVRLRVLNGIDEEEIAKNSKSKDDQISIGMHIRIELLNDKPPTLMEVKDLGMADRQYIREELYETIDGGIDTDVDCTCPKCGTDFVHTVEVGERGFFFPSQVLRTWRKKSTS